MNQYSEWTPEFYISNTETCLKQLADKENLRRVSLLNTSPLEAFADGALVRFRGIIQDMRETVYYRAQFEIESDDGKVRVQNGRFRNYVLKDNERINEESSSNENAEARNFLLTSIPMYNDWAAEIEQRSCCRLSPPGIRSTLKRPLDEEEIEVKSVKKCSLASNPTNTNEDNVESHLPVISTLKPEKSCLAMLYADYDSLTLNTVVEVVGFLSVQTSNEDIEMDDDGFSQPTVEPNSVARLHVIHLRKLDHINPLLDNTIVDNSPDVHDPSILKDILLILTQCLFGDTIAAEYLLCHLISRIYIRTDYETLGQFTLNLSNLPPACPPDFTQLLYSIIESMMPASHLYVMSLENLNAECVVPKKDFITDKVVWRLLQLAPCTHLVLDETKLQQGQLKEVGVKNVGYFTHLIKLATVKYDFQHYDIEFNADIPMLVVSEGKSILPSNYHLPLLANDECVPIIRETIEAVRHFMQPKLATIRAYLTLARHNTFNLLATKDGADHQIVQNDFVEMRRTENVTPDDLHLLLVLARLQALSRDYKTFDQECWNTAKHLERTRRQRLSNCKSQ